ncbi:hypothetical protein EXS73_03730 [Candidatus Pacearchaeota archaeon]|nr:hypothetical protein [Candidatus Pacearchaeota archaeon]
MITEKDSRKYLEERGYRAWYAEGYAEEAQKIANRKSQRNENALFWSTLVVGGLLLGMAYVQNKYNPQFLYSPPVTSQIHGIR